MVSKNLLTNCGPLSVSRCVGIPYGTKRWSRKIFAICVAEVSKVGIALVSSEYLSVITTTYWFTFTVFGSGPSMSMATKLRGLDGGNNWSGCRWR